MTCARCGKANREEARFCDGCGGPLARRCPACGVEGRPGAAFCDACGTALAAKPDPVEARKTVTIVFADLIGSTSLHERLDPESVRRVMDHYYRSVRAPIEVHGGTVVQLLGDGVMCAFGVPLVAEDDAIRAVRAAVAVQEAFREFAREEHDVVGDVGLRVAVNTGEVVVTDEHAAGIGDPLNVAARLQQEARDGDVLIGESTERLVRDVVTLEPVGTVSLRGRAETVRAFRVLSLERPTGVAAVAFVGRDDELRRLLAVYESAVRAPGTRLATILGSPGVGKSRLLVELARRLGARATMLSARCDAAGGGTFAPMADALRAHLRLADGAGRDAVRAAVEALLPGEESARIATGIAALLAGTPAPPEETFFVVRRLLAAVAATQPVVLTIDDVQWAEPLLLDLVEHLVQWGAGTPLLILVAARPELRDSRSSLANPDDLVAAVVTIGGLDAGAATRLAANVIGAEALPAAIAGRVLATSEGNPLFVGELVRMLVHDGILRREGDRWTTGAELATFEMPPTIHALLAARIERLKPAERTVLERAAIVGRHFSRAAVANLLPSDITDLDARLETLRRSELIEPDTGWLLGEPVMRFHHVLIRDAAYRRVLKGTRAELHARFADWLESRSGEAVEHDETLGWHLEQAHQNLRELGPVDAKGRALGERAARHLGAAGRRALARDDLPLAASLLGRAIARLDPDDPARPDLALDWCEALLASGDVGPAAAAIDEVGRFAAGSARLRAWHTCFAGQRAVMTDPQSLRPTAEAVAASAVALAAEGDAAGEAKAHAVQATALGRLGEFGAAEAALDRALAAARRARDRRRANAVLAGAPLAALWGPSPVTRASGRCLDVVRVLRITQGAPAVEAVALRCQAVLEALRGRTEAARRMIASSRRMVEELGITQRLLEADMFAGIIELLEGDAAAAERSLREAYEGFRRLGLRIDVAQAAALLGRALLAAGRAAEAEALSHESEALAGDDLKAAIAWRGVRAEALAQRGEHDTAVTLARAAVGIAAATDALLDHADARLALAAALRAAGRADEASAEELRAIELWETKGASLLAERARRDMGRPPAPASLADGRGAAHRPRRSPAANAASAASARLDVWAAAGDRGAWERILAADFQFVHHPTGGTPMNREDTVACFGQFVDSDEPTTRHTVLATLGDSLALSRRWSSMQATAESDVAPFGAVELDWFEVLEVNESGQVRRVDVYDAKHLGDAIARLYGRYAEMLPEGPVRARAAAIARTMEALVGPLDPDRWAGVAAPVIDIRDHRTLGYPSGRVARARWADTLRVVIDTAEHHELRTDDVLDLRADAVLLRRAMSGTDRASGGAFERVQLALFTCGADGLLSGYELFEADREEQAQSRLDELTGASKAPRRVVGTPSPARFTNAAVRAVEEFSERWLARDWDGVMANTSPAATLDDRRRLMRLRVSGEDYVTHARLMFATKFTLWQPDLLATRGDRLALFRVRTESETRGVEAAAEFLWILEVDERGRRETAVFMDLEDVEAAYAELDDRYAAGEGAAHAELLGSLRAFRVASEERDWDAVARLLPADFTLRSHRRLVGIASVIDRDEYLATRDRLQDLRLQGRMRVDHALRLGRRAGADVTTWYGTIDGGEFEDQFVRVYDHDGRRAHHVELFDVDQLDAALARYEELEGGTAARFANTASRLLERGCSARTARDWQQFAAPLAPAFRCFERRRMVLLELDREAFLRYTRPLFDLSARLVVEELIATRDDRFALVRVRGVGQDGGGDWASRVELLCIGEVDARGELVALVVFDPEDLDAAYADLDDRWDAAERAADKGHPAAFRFPALFAAREWERIEAVLTPTIVVQDHRPLGWGTIDGSADYIALLQSLAELSPDAVIRVEHARRQGRGILNVTMVRGTREGGAFEDPRVLVGEIDAQDRVCRFDFYSRDQLDAALARFEALRDEPAIDTPAVGVMNRIYAAWEARDWAGFAALLPPSLHIIDRRRIVQLMIDRQRLLEGARVFFDMASSRAERTLLATRGERLALARIEWRGTDAVVGPSEIDFLELLEVDAAGDLAVMVFFDSRDLAVAHAELDARHRKLAPAPRPEPLRIPPNAATRTSDRWHEAFDRRDWAALETEFAPVVEYDDRRRVTRLSGDRATLIASVRHVGSEPNTRVSRVVLTTAGDRLVLERYRWMGGNPGADFELEGLCVTEVDAQGRVVAHVVFDLDDRRAASGEMLERFVRSDAGRVLPSTSVEMLRALFDHDLERVRAVLMDDFVVDDHRRTGIGRIQGADAYVAALAALFAETPDVVVEPLYQIALEPHGMLAVAHTFGTLVGGGEFENVFVQIGCHDPEGIVCAEIYELDDLDTARARFEALRPKAELIPPNAASRVRDLTHAAFDAEDWDGWRGLLSPDYVYDDKRKRALVTGGVDVALESLVLVRSLPGIRFGRERIATIGDRIMIEHIEARGGPKGGEVEWGAIRLTEIDAHERVKASIDFDVEDRKQAFIEAHERFAAGEASAAGCHTPIVALHRAFVAQDWEGIRRCMADDLVLRDHRALGVLDMLSRDAWIDSVRVQADLTTELSSEPCRVLAWGRAGCVELGRICGKADGGDFEHVVVRVVVTDGTRIRHFEVFDAGDEARALARFEELSAASSAARAAG